MKILLIVYDNEMYINVFPVGLGYIGAVLKKAGFDVEIYNQDMHHHPEEHLTRHLDKHHFDMVGLGIIGGYFQYKKLLRDCKLFTVTFSRHVLQLVHGHFSNCPEV